ncbi:hypothetical protein Q4503_16650 [Colwellia sp. 6_MG-2023]|uniref:plasmid replication protein, CyRepA1 family n=1 Tax=Colwellia sp. 6_MG-2023 TaxID=3062676 RepID=UPI0026E157B0|nr:plasmid replication protein, CyRepA1 family [Colwellia sp. 6_MG-2023]MDO6489327.1 hypothetical protein [Colwellia sp. 6_MG-2023]
MKKMSLQQFYKDKFNSDPRLLMAHSEAFNQLSLEADNAYIIWSEICNDIDPSRMGGNNSDKFTGRVSVSNTKYKGRAAVYSNLRTSDDNTFEYPTVNFVLKGSNVGGWSGLSLLVKLYKEHKGTITDDERLKWQRESDAKKKALIAKQSEAKQKEIQQEEEKSLLNQRYNELFQCSPHDDGSHPYLASKNVGDIVQHIDVRLCLEFDDKYSQKRRGQEFLAIRFVDINGEYVGLQRIYSDGTKLNTPGFNFSNGAHCIIGDINAANKDFIYAGEGFATCASAMLAMHNHKIANTRKKSAVIVGINSNNLKKCLSLFKEKNDELKINHLADNDQWKNQQGKGNAGLLISCFAVDVLGYKSVVPLFEDYTFNNLELDDRPTDFNDLHCLAGLNEVRRQLKAQRNKFKSSGKNPFDKTCRELRYIAVGHKNKKLFELVNRAIQQGVQLYPIHYGVADILGCIDHNIKHLYHLFDKVSYFNELQGRLNWIIGKRVNNAQAFRSFSKDAISKPHINYKKFNETRITPEIFSYIKNLSGAVVVRAPMGSGKTQHLLSPLMANTDKAAYFAHRVSLIASSVGNLNKHRTQPNINSLKPVELSHVEHIFSKSFSPASLTRPLSNDYLVQNYQDFKGNGMGVFARSVEQMALCINSITNPSFAPLLQELDFSAFDEAAQTLRHVADGSACDKPEMVYSAMINTIKNTSNQVILCDADANDEVIEMCEQARPGEIIHVVELDTDFSDIKIKYTDNGDQVFNQVFTSVENNEKVLVANDSATNGKSMYERLKELFPSKRFLFIYQDSKGNADVDFFNQNPDVAVNQQQYDAVIYSPCISSGVSLESGYFTKHFAILCGTVAPSDAIQMIRRDRCAKEFIIGFNKQNTQYPETKEEIIIGMIKADDINLNLDLSDGMMRLGRLYTKFDDMRINVIAKQNKARNDFANNMLLILQGDKYQLERLATNEIDKEVGSAQRKLGREIAKAIDLELQLTQETPEKDIAERLRTEDLLSVEERAQLKRYDIETQLCSSVTTETIEFNNDRGITKVKNFELLQGTIEQANKFDISEIATNVSFSARERKTAKMTLQHKVFDMLGINKTTGEGTFTGDKMRQVRDTLLESTESIMLYNTTKIGAYIHPQARKKKCATTFIKNILAKCGLELSSQLVGNERKRVTFINPESWQVMQSYYQARQLQEVSSLEPLQYDTDMVDIKRSGLSIDISVIDKPDHQTLNYAKMSSNALAITVRRAIDGLGIEFESAISLLDDETITDIVNNDMEIDMLSSYFSSKLKYEQQLQAVC